MICTRRTLVLISYCLLIASGKCYKNYTYNRSGNGITVPIQLYPYAVQIAYKGTHICMGTIISDRFILTSATCAVYKSIKRYSIYAGSNQINQGTVFKVCRIVKHEAYEDTLYNIALMLLKSKIKFNSRMRSIEIAPNAEWRDSPSYVSPFTIVGLDLIHVIKGQEYKAKLKVSRLSYLSDYGCKVIAKVPEYNFCLRCRAGGCIEDSGTGAVYSNRHLVGIKNDHSHFLTGVFTDVTSFRKWIQKKMKILLDSNTCADTSE